MSAEPLDRAVAEGVERLLVQAGAGPAFWFGMVTGDDRDRRVALRERLCAAAADEGLRVRVRLPRAEELASLVPDLRRGRDWDLQWIVAEGPGATPARWEREVMDLLRALNHGRDALRRELPGGLVVEGGSRLTRALRAVAPDLFAIRAVFVDLGERVDAWGPRPRTPDPEPERLDTAEFPAPSEAALELAHVDAWRQREGVEPSQRKTGALLRAARALLARGEGAAADAVLHEAKEAAQALPRDEGAAVLRFRVELELARRALERGDLPLAEAAGQEALAIVLAQVASRESGSGGWTWRLRRAHDVLGDLALAQGDLGRSEAHRQAGFAAGLALLDQEPHVSAWLRAVAISENRLGDVALAAGRIADARRWYSASAERRVVLADGDPEHPVWRRDLAIAADKEGDVAWEEGDAAAAEDAWRRALDLRRQLAAEPDADPRVLRELAWSHARVAVVEADAGFPEQALEHEEAGVAVLRGLNHDRPADALVLAALADALLSVAERRGELGDAGGAALAVREGLEVLEGQAGRDPGAVPTRLRLAEALELAAELEAEDPVGGLGRAVTIRREAMGSLGERHPFRPDQERDLARALEALAQGLEQQGRLEEARHALEEALSWQIASAGPSPDGRARARLAEGLLDLATLAARTGASSALGFADAAIHWLDDPSVPDRPLRLAAAREAREAFDGPPSRAFRAQTSRNFST